MLGPGAGAVVRKTAQRAGKGFPGWVWFWKRLLCMSRMFLGRPYERADLPKQWQGQQHTSETRRGAVKSFRPTG